MDELARKVREASDSLQPVWSEERSRELFTGVERLRRRRLAARTAAGTGVAMAAAVALMVWAPTPMSQPAPQVVVGSQSPALGKVKSPGPLAAAVVEEPAAAGGSTQSLAVRAGGASLGDGHRLRFSDGSLAALAGQQSELEILRDGEDRVALSLARGGAHFDVVPRAERDFEVVVGGVKVTVVGTVFQVERRAGRVRVSVSEGRVRVDSDDETRYLAAGEWAWFGDPEGNAPEAVDAMPPSGRAPRMAAAPSSPRRPTAAAPEVGWRSLSQAGQYEAAYAVLSTGDTIVDNEPAALMDAADAARLSGHPRGAVRYLERVLREHGTSPVAPLAAFTLGRVLLDRLGEPHRAARAFGRARSLAPRGSLAQDALAREVEALSKGGHAREANLRAQEYVRTYPRGQRLRAVRLYGGLELE